MFVEKTITDLSPRWVVIASGHIQGGQAASFRFNNLDSMITAVTRLRAFGYSAIRTYPHKVTQEISNVS